MTRQEQKQKAQEKAWGLLEGFLEGNETIDRFSYSKEEDGEDGGGVEAFKEYMDEQLDELRSTYDDIVSCGMPHLAAHLAAASHSSILRIEVDKDALIETCVEWFNLKYHSRLTEAN